MSKCTFVLMPRTGKLNAEVCMLLNSVLILKQPLHICTDRYLVPFVTVRYLLLSASSFYHSMYSSNIQPNFNVGHIARTLQSSPILQSTKTWKSTPAMLIQPDYTPKVLLVWIFLNSCQEKNKHLKPYINSFLKLGTLTSIILAFYSDSMLYRTVA